MKGVKRPLSILFLQNRIPPYRIPVYNFLAQSGFNVTVAHAGNKTVSDSLLFKEIILRNLKLGPFNYPLRIKQLTKNYDAVIVMFDLWWLSYIKLVFNKNSKIIFWGHGLGKTRNRLAIFLRKHLADKADAIVFYTEPGKENFITETGIKNDKCFVAQNTLLIPNTGISDTQKKYFLYTGRLQKRKKLDELIVAYNEVSNEVKARAGIFILGDGDEVKSELQQLVNTYNLEQHVHFHPATYNDDELKFFFDNAYAYVSPSHVGLGIVHSFAYGTPVITRQSLSDCPEFAYCNQENSYLYSGSFAELTDILELVVENKNLQASKSKAAFNFYKENLSINKMAEGFINAISHTLTLDK